ncbi:MAG: phosphoribosylanthranilate isomerase [Oscillospiraceae bacterium]|nr:phosphoribosylanthranilate isomerase [Oscillospiraceae bacterium]
MKKIYTAVKFCGMRRRLDIEYANECRPDYAGFILSDGFRRSIVMGTFYELVTYLDKDIKRVGVFVNEPIENILNCHYNQELDVIQLHGNENEDYIKTLRKDFSGEIWKAVRAQSPGDIGREQKKSCDKLLIDSYSEDCVGGTGKRINTENVKNANIGKPFFIAGGLDGENIAEIIRETAPYGVDVSSGIETEGCKDIDKMKKIMSILRKENLR